MGPEGSSWGARPLLPSQTHLEELLKGAADPACSWCYCFQGKSTARVLFFQLSHVSPACRLCRLPRNLSQQAGWAGFAKQHGSWRGLGVGSPVHGRHSNYTRLFS